jgi:hypothetical protein
MMTKKVRRAPYRPDAKGIKDLLRGEIVTILRGADNLNIIELIRSPAAALEK